MSDELSMDQVLINKLNDVLEVNLENELFGVKELAEEIGLSRAQLHRKLHALTGKSTSQFIREFRLEKAMKMLQDNVATASEIAYRVGFNSPTYFNTCFREYYGYTPGEVKYLNPLTDVDSKNIQIVKQADYNQDLSTISLVKKISFRQRIILFFSLGLLLIIAFSYYFYFNSKNYFNTKTTKSEVNEKSIAVLPLHNLTGQEDNDYFVDGMHDALIGELGKVSSLRVISRTSTLRYRNSDMLLKDISNELGVNTIVEGSIIRAGDSLRILIQLIDVFPEERHLFVNEYYDGMQNVLEVQSSAVKDIAKEINIKLSKNEEQRLAKPRTVDPETYKAYLRGMYYLNQGTQASFETGINYLKEAIDRDPGDPFAYAGLALGYSIIGHGQLNSEEAFLRAMSAANKAIKLDPNVDEAYTALSILYLYNVWDWPKTKEAFENAIANNPNNEIAHAHFAWYHILFDDMDKSIYHAKKAAMIEPFSASYAAWLGLLYYHNQEYDKAEYWAKKALILKEDVPYGNLTLGWVSLQRKQYKQAIEFHKKLPEKGVYWKTLLGYAYVKAGQRDKALALWNELEEYSKNNFVNSCYKGMMAAYLGFTDKAFELLNDACENKHYPITYINFSPCTENLRNDPRYDKLLQKMNLPHRKALLSSNQ